MNQANAISSMKCPSLTDANAKAVFISNNKGEHVGKLVPVGDWILGDQEKIAQICAWRQKAMRMFLVQFESTYEKTYKYLKDLSIRDQGRLFFLIFDKDNRFVGHIGVSNITDHSFELDNLMRGENGGDPRLIYLSEMTLIDWAYKNLNVETSYVRVLSYNWMVLNLHEEVGYVKKEAHKLYKHEEGGVIMHDFSKSECSNVGYSCVVMELSKKKFYATGRIECLQIESN